jgi:hypothetical protein
MSIIRFVLFVANTVIAPPFPAGTMAALATIFPSKEFNVETLGIGCPVGQTVRYCSGPLGTTVMLSE